MNDGKASSVTRRPLIGITTRLDLKNDTFYLRRYYAEAIAAAGGIPVYVPLISDGEALAALAERLDGILLSGSNSDLDPLRYGEEPHQRLGHVVVERDTVDLTLLKYAETSRVPLLGICFGLQSLNVSRGGTLVQDLAAQVPGSFKHEQEPPYGRPSHTIEIEPGSLLARLAGSRRVQVNSTHHQAVKAAGNNLRVVARGLDGVVEAVEDQREDRFVLGVQWHPELGWKENGLSRAIFAAFIAATHR
ncbi:MAG: gamma-glutamyl-gamma-aminobutyrate hydrolase family protein [Acidobacteriota bacterium]